MKRSWSNSPKSLRPSTPEEVARATEEYARKKVGQTIAKLVRSRDMLAKLDLEQDTADIDWAVEILTAVATRR